MGFCETELSHTEASPEGGIFAPDMHSISPHRFYPRTQRDEGYYRIKDSFRDLTDRVRSRVMMQLA